MYKRVYFVGNSNGAGACTGMREHDACHGIEGYFILGALWGRKDFTLFHLIGLQYTTEE